MEQEKTVEESQRSLASYLLHHWFLDKAMQCFHQVAVPLGMYIATYDYWRSSHIWLVPEGEGVAFLEDSYDLGASPSNKDTYFHIAMNPQPRKYLRFHIQGQSCEFKALPFGLSTAPMGFTMVIKKIKLMVQNKGIRIHQFLDYWLIRAKYDQTFLHIQTLVDMCWPVRI